MNMKSSIAPCTSLWFMFCDQNRKITRHSTTAPLQSTSSTGATKITTGVLQPVHLYAAILENKETSPPARLKKQHKHTALFTLQQAATTQMPRNGDLRNVFDSPLFKNKCGAICPIKNKSIIIPAFTDIYSFANCGFGTPLRGHIAKTHLCC